MGKIVTLLMVIGIHENFYSLQFRLTLIGRTGYFFVYKNIYCYVGYTKYKEGGNSYMNKEHIDEWADINKFVKTLSAEGRQKLYEELKRSGSVENPIKYTETHLEGGIEDSNLDKVNFAKDLE